MSIKTILPAALFLCAVLGAPAVACEPGDCRNGARSRTAARPLDLQSFMRPARAPATRPRPGGRTSTRALPATVEALPPAPPALTEDAASALAAQRPAATRIWQDDQLNDIDRAVAGLPAATAGASPPREDDVQVVDATAYNEIDRKADDTPARRPRALAPLPQSDGGAEFWMQRLWRAIIEGLAAIANAWQRLFG